MINLTNQVALITGGSRGIGAAAAMKFAEAGADVAIMYASDNKSAASAVHRMESAGVQASAFRGNVQSYADCSRVVRNVVKRFGRIDILVNNAGIWERGDILTMKPSDWDRTIKINLNSIFNMTRLVAPVMKKQKYGRIINISSTAGIRGEAYHSHYATSKGGTIAFTKSVAIELIRHGINVNCVAPGWVQTDMTAHIFRNRKKNAEIIEQIPRHLVPGPDDIAGPILFLASNLANHLVGTVLNVNGGSVL